VVCKDSLLTTQHGAIEGKTQTKLTKFYNLDVIISVGYRVKSKRGTQFSIGASLKDLGKKLFAFSKMQIKPQELLKKI
jgi:hypothetical protein